MSLANDRQKRLQMNKLSMMASSEPSQPLAPAPVTSVTMQNLYLDVFQPLFFPVSSEFIQPLLDSFVIAHDELLEDNSLFTIPARTREIGVEIDGTIREFRRRESSTPSSSDKQGADQTSLSEVRKLRLRARMQTVYLPFIHQLQDALFLGGSFLKKMPRIWLLDFIYGMLNNGGQQAGPKDGSGQILRRSEERIEKFDKEMKQLEEAALKEFKEGIRKAVAASTK